MIRKIIRAFYRIILYIIYRFYYSFKRTDPYLVAFSSDVDYSDNSRALYEYMHRNKLQYNYVWLLHKSEIPPARPNTEFVQLFSSIRSVALLAKAKYIFYTHPLGNLFHPRKGQIVINLWHGIPFKGVKGDNPPTIPPFNILLCLGENNISTIAKFVGCDESYVRPWGYPRIDLLVSNCKDGQQNPFAPKGFEGKLIMWMPTFRKSPIKKLSEETCDSETGLPLLRTIEEIHKFNDYLIQVGVVVIIKVHHLQTQKDAFKTSCSNIIFLQDKDIISKGYQLYEIVAKSDALLTDYSSIFADYLVLNKPIGFILDDLKDYENCRGSFMYNPITDVLGGSHIYDYNQLKAFCEEISIGIDSTSKFRNKVKKMMIKYPDGNNCQRIINNLGM